MNRYMYIININAYGIGSILVGYSEMLHDGLCKYLTIYVFRFVLESQVVECSMGSFYAQRF